jgi:hypothetical protein
MNPNFNQKRYPVWMQGATGAFAGITADMIFYGIDSYKLIQQTKEKFTISRMFRGMIPVAVLGSGPSFAIFFSAYEFAKSRLEGYLPIPTVVLAASCMAGIPASIVSVPADVLKKRMILQKDSNLSIFQMTHEILKSDGVRGLFLGWKAN